MIRKKDSNGQSSKYIGEVFIALALIGFGWMIGADKISFDQRGNSPGNNLPSKLDYSGIDAIYSSLKSNYDGELKEEELIEGLKAGLVRAVGDPYTEYMSPDLAGDFDDSLNGRFEGIGAELGKDKDNNVIIISPIPGYPASKVGLMPQDVIVEIDGESAYDITISEAVDRIRGEKGTDVTIKVARDGEIKDYTITRQEINIPSVEYSVKDGVGLLTISRFGDDTVGLAREAADYFVAENVKSVVLDLRGNTGGYLTGAVDIASLWLDRGSVILTEKKGELVTDTFKANGSPKLGGVKTIVLVNEGSASASEIVAGALRDNEKATLVGQKTYGKGSVQLPINLKDGGVLKVTVAKWFTPNDKNINKEGIEPDVAIEMTSEDVLSGKDPQKEEALRILRD